MIGHVRAATVGNLRTENTHPFRYRQWLFAHTGTVDGYLIEGHVPVADIKRLLQTRPKVRGIAVPGMPAGTPGMEMPGGAVAPYDVIAFDAAGRTTVFASHR